MPASPHRPDAASDPVVSETKNGFSFSLKPRDVWLLLFFLAALAALAALLFDPACLPVRRVREALPYPFQLDAEEGFLLGQALRLAGGQGLYASIDNPPHLVDNYPPLYPFLWSLFVDPSAPSLSAGRWISGLSAGAVGLAVAFIVFFQAFAGKKRRPENAGPEKPDFRNAGAALWGAQIILIAWCAPILFLVSHALLRWVAYTRVDLMALAFAVWGLAVFGLWGERHRGARAAAVCLFALALLTKQNMVIAPLACFLWMLGRNRRAALWFAFWMLLAAGLPVLLLCVMTDGRYWAHTVSYNRNVMHWGDLWRNWLPHVWRLYRWLLAAAAVLGVWLAWDRRNGLPLWLIYFVLNALSLVSLAKAGSAENYLLEPQAALALFLGTGLSRALGRAAGMDCASGGGEKRFTKSAAWMTAAAVLIFLFLHAGLLRRAAPVLYRNAPRPSLEALLKGQQVVRLIAERDGPILSEDPIYGYLAGRPAEFQHFIMTQLAAERKWDEAPFVERVKQREFALVVAHQNLMDEAQFFNRYSPALRRALRENYEWIAPLPRPRPLQPIFLYVPRRTD